MGRCLLLADVHANLRALEAVLLDASGHGGFDVIWMLGDIIGYGPEPDECVERLREFPLVCVAGNHDLGVVGSVDLCAFNRDAATACMWSRSRLSQRTLSFLGDLPLEQRIHPFHLVHGSPRNPVWEYVVSSDDAHRAGRFCLETHCLTGHTHVPAAFSMVPGRVVPSACVSNCVRVVMEGRVLMNPGAVGQPRDGDPRAAYAILDDGDPATVSFHRVVYDVAGTFETMLRLGLPPALAQRLHTGY